MVEPPTVEDYQRELDRYAKCVSALSAAEKQIEELREALEPFAKKATGWESRHPAGRRPWPDTSQLSHRLGDFRRARAVYEKTAKGGNDENAG